MARSLVGVLALALICAAHAEVEVFDFEDIFGRDLLTEGSGSGSGEYEFSLTFGNTLTTAQQDTVKAGIETATKTFFSLGDGNTVTTVFSATRRLLAGTTATVTISGLSSAQLTAVETKRSGATATTDFLTGLATALGYADAAAMEAVLGDVVVSLPAVDNAASTTVTAAVALVSAVMITI